MSTTPTDKLLGTKIAGKYTVTKVLGEGGMGTVYGGVHAWTDREVALKVLKPELARNTEIVRRFLAEARSAARIKHPNVVDVLDMGNDEAHGVFIALEWLDGEPLKERLKRDGALSPLEAVALLEPAMDALAMAHEKHDVVHRDIKPDNIFLARDPRAGIVPKVLDFGIAKVKDDEFGGRTQTGSMIGTPWYMSPEQVMGEKTLSTPSDVWSFAVMLYETISRKRPFLAQNSNAAMVMIARDEPRPLQSVAPMLSPSVCQVIDGALKKTPSERPTMRAFSEQLMAAVGLTEAQAITLRANLGGVNITGSHRYEGPRPDWASSTSEPGASSTGSEAPHSEPEADSVTQSSGADPASPAQNIDPEVSSASPLGPNGTMPLMAVADTVDGLATTASVAVPAGGTDPGLKEPTETPMATAAEAPRTQAKPSRWIFAAAAAAILIAGVGLGVNALFSSDASSPSGTAEQPLENAISQDEPTPPASDTGEAAVATGNEEPEITTPEIEAPVEQDPVAANNDGDDEVHAPVAEVPETDHTTSRRNRAGGPTRTLRRVQIARDNPYESDVAGNSRQQSASSRRARATPPPPPPTKRTTGTGASTTSRSEGWGAGLAP